MNSPVEEVQPASDEAFKSNAATDMMIASQAERLAAYIELVRKGHYAWYEHDASRQYIIWRSLDLTSIVTPALATLIGAIALALGYFDEPLIKGIVTTLPVVSTVASGILARLGSGELEDARERGRQQCEQAIEIAELDLSMARSRDEIAAIHRSLIDTIARIDESQHVAHHKLTQQASRRDPEFHSGK